MGGAHGGYAGDASARHTFLQRPYGHHRCVCQHGADYTIAPFYNVGPKLVGCGVLYIPAPSDARRNTCLESRKLHK